MASATNTSTESTGESDTDTDSATTQGYLTDTYQSPDAATENGVTATPNGQPPAFAIPPGIDLSTLLMAPAELEAAMELPYEHAAELIQTPPTATLRFTGAIDYQTLEILTDHLSSVVTESRIAITEEGWYIAVMDSANVVRMSAWLPATDWRTYECDREGVIALGWTGTGGTVTSALNHIDSGATIDITYADRLITFDDGIPLEFGTIDPDSTRAVPEAPELVLSNSITLPGIDLKELTTRMDDVSDHLVISGQPQTDSVELVAEGDTAVIRKAYGEAADLTEATNRRTRRLFAAFIANADRSVFSLEYLKDFITAPRKGTLKTGYTCRFGDELPLRIERELGDNGFLRYLQAPRIQGE
jgi:DNA polymerase III sliding clamp (beta) subunit (PCNA family)